MGEILNRRQPGPYPVAKWYDTGEDLGRHIEAGELVVTLLATGAYLGIYGVEPDLDRTAHARVAFSGNCRIDRIDCPCQVEIDLRSRQGDLWLMDA